MSLRNNAERYGYVAVVLHWLSAAVLLGLFGLGLWMVGLDYYHPWYHQSPWWHRSFGVLVAVLMLLRLMFRCCDQQPKTLLSISRFEQVSATVTHLALYLVVFAVVISGYLMSTADGQAVTVFNWFELPALNNRINNQEDIAGDIHQYLAWVMMVLACLHALAAVKHHFVDKDRTLLKMLGR